MKLYSMTGADAAPLFPLDMTLILNSASPLVLKLSSLAECDDEKAKKVAKQMFYLSLISQRQLTASEMKEFISESYDMLSNI